MNAPRAVLIAASVAAATVLPPAAKAASLDDFKHIVVIYQENHSFDNLYGRVGRASTACRNADPAHTTQVGQDGDALHLPAAERRQPDVAAAAGDLHRHHDRRRRSQSALHQRAVHDRRLHPADATTCPAPGDSRAQRRARRARGCRAAARATSCTASTRSSTSSTAASRTATSTGQRRGRPHDGRLRHDRAADLPVPAPPTAHRATRSPTTSSRRRSAARSSTTSGWSRRATPVFADAANDGGANDLHSVVDANGMPASTRSTQPAGPSAKDPATLTASCNPPAEPRPARRPGIACGDYAVNTIQPSYQPYAPGTAGARRLPPQTRADDRRPAERRRRRLGLVLRRLVERERRRRRAGLDQRHTGRTCARPGRGCRRRCYPNCPDKLFQFHHQPFNYFANYAPGTAARAAHLRDEAEFLAAAKAGDPASRSASSSRSARRTSTPATPAQPDGSDHLVDLLKADRERAAAPRTRWSSSPTTSSAASGTTCRRRPKAAPTPGIAHDQWGPGTRIPALLIAERFTRSAVDHTEPTTRPRS